MLMIDYTFYTIRWCRRCNGKTLPFWDGPAMHSILCTITARTNALHAHAATIFIYVHQTKVKTGLPCVGWSSLQWL